MTFGTSSRESVLPLFVSDGLAGAPRVWQSPASPETLILFEVNSHVACGSAGSSFELIAVDFDRGTARSLARAAYEEHLLDGRDAASITSHGQSELEIRIRIPRDSAPHERPLLDVEPVSDDVIVRTVSRCEIAIRVHSDAGRGVGSCSRCGLR